MTPTVEKVRVLTGLGVKESALTLECIKRLGGVSNLAGDVGSYYGHLCSQLIEFGRMECRFRPQFSCEDCLADPCPLIEEFGV